MQVVHTPKIKPADMTIKEIFAYIRELEAENARLEEAYQKATGEIATDPLPSAVVDRERLNEVANEIGENIEYDNDKIAIAVFVNELEKKLFGGAQRD